MLEESIENNKKNFQKEEEHSLSPKAFHNQELIDLYEKLEEAKKSLKQSQNNKQKNYSQLFPDESNQQDFSQLLEQHNNFKSEDRSGEHVPLNNISCTIISQERGGLGHGDQMAQRGDYSNNQKNYNNNHREDYTGEYINKGTVSNQEKMYMRAQIKQNNQNILQQMINKDIKRLANQRKISESSYKLLIEKLEKNLTILLKDIDQADTNFISFEQLGRILCLLGIFTVIEYNEKFQLENQEMFFSHEAKQQKRRYEEMVMHEQIWKKLVGQKQQTHINIELVYSFFRIILDPARIPASDVAVILAQYINKYKEQDTLNTSVQHNNKQSNIIINNNNNYEQNEQIETPSHFNNHNNQTNNDALRIWTGEELVNNFREFNKSRLAYTKIGYMKPKKIEEYQEKQFCSFKPQTNLTSNNIDQQLQLQQQEEPTEGNDQQQERVKQLYRKQEVYQEQKRMKQQEQSQKLMKECTFKPQITHSNSSSTKPNTNSTVNRLYTLDYIKKREILKMQAQQQKQIEELEECSFRPRLNNNYNNNNSQYQQPNQQKQQQTIQDMPKGFTDTVGRMRQAQLINKRKKEQLEHIPTGENYEKVREANIQPPSFLQKKKINKKVPFIHIDINVAPGRQGRIALNEGDDPFKVAKKFAQTFSLNKEMQENLVQVLIQQLETHQAEKQKVQ